MPVATAPAEFEALLTVAELCSVLRISRGTAARLVASGALPRVNVGDRGVRFRVSDVRAYLEARVHQKT